METITFSVNLANDFDGIPPYSQSEAAGLVQNRFCYIPTWVGNAGVEMRRHGETFTLTGYQAVHLKWMVLQGAIPFLTIV